LRFNEDQKTTTTNQQVATDHATFANLVAMLHQCGAELCRNDVLAQQFEALTYYSVLCSALLFGDEVDSP